MKMGIKALFAGLATASVLVLGGCGEQQAESEVLKVGTIAGSETQVAEVAKKVAAEKFGLEVELVTFSDYVTPNIALNDGEIDLNAFQHKPYLDAQIQDRGYDLVPVGNTFVYPIAGYSKTITSVDALQSGDQIAVPNDPTNLGRALLLLEQQGIITLAEDAGLQATPLDVVANPKGIQLVEMEAAQLPRALEDVALAVINTTYASQIDLLPTRDGLFVEGKDSPYVNLIVAREDNQDAEKVKQFVQAYQTDEVYQAASEIFKNSVVKGW